MGPIVNRSAKAKPQPAHPQAARDTRKRSVHGLGLSANGSQSEGVRPRFPQRSNSLRPVTGGATRCVARRFASRCVGSKRGLGAVKRDTLAGSPCFKMDTQREGRLR